MTTDFIQWFAAGFILQMIAIGAALISCCALAIKSGALLKFSSGFIGCVQCLGGLAWFIVGQVYRWRTAGMIAAGVDNMPVTAKLMGMTVPYDHIPGTLIMSGNFIQIWLIIVYSLCGCCCLLAICGAVFAKKK